MFSPLCLRRNLCLWRLSSHLCQFAGWLLRHLLSHRLRLASTFVAQPPLASILYRPSSFAPVGCHVESCRTASTSRRAAGSHIASCDTSASHPPACPLLHCHFCRPLFQHHGHCRCPQMHGTLSRRQLYQCPLPPLAQVSIFDTLACTAASSSLLLLTRGGYNKIKL